MASLKLALVIDAYNPIVGDIYLTPQGTDRLTNTLSEEVAQWLYTMFRFFQGEWFLDLTQGVPWYQQILGFKVSTALVASILRQVIQRCPGISGTKQFSLTSVGRNWKLNFAVQLSDGTILTSSDFAPLIIKGP